jgi:hypothetical protein
VARLGLLAPLIEQAHDAIRAVRNGFAHSATDPSLAEPRHQKRLQRVDPEAETSALMSRPCRGGCRRRWCRRLARLISSINSTLPHAPALLLRRFLRR